MKKLISVIIAVLMIASVCMFTVSAGDEDALAVRDSKHWKIAHQWDFNNNVNDSVGGIVPVPARNETFTMFQEPSYRDGRIILSGASVYNFPEPIEVPKGGLRIDVKGKFDFSNAAGQGAHRIFGCNIDGQRNSGLNYINIAGAQYQSYSVALSTTSQAWNSFVLFPNKATHDMEQEHVLSFIYQNGKLLYFMDNELMCPVTDNAQGGAFVFNDFLGCSYVNTKNNNATGEIDWIKMYFYSEEEVTEPTSGGNEGEPSSETADGMFVASVAVVVTGAVAFVCVKKKEER